MSLKLASLTYQELKIRLQTDLPNVDDQTLRDTLEGITDLHEMIAAVIRSALVDEALGSGLRSRMDDMKERLSRLELRASKKRELALHAMSEVGLSKLEQPDFTASMRAGSPALVVVSEQTIPSDCRNHLSSIGKAFSASSSVVQRSPEPSSAILNLY